MFRVKMESLSLKCDACGHLEPIQELSADLIGTPCPKCGADMLTQGDYDDAVALKNAIGALDELGSFLLSALGLENEELVPAPRVAINPHDGEITVSAAPDPKPAAV